MYQVGLFGTSGIRGVVNKDHYPDFYLHMALVIGTVVKNRKMVIAADGRLTMPVVKSAYISGLTATGHDVIDIGVLPTPALQYYCKTYKMPGVMITASHNPPEYNGVKLIMADGLDTYRKEHEMIEKLYSSSGFNETGGKNRTKIEIKYAAWDSVGKLINDPSGRELYIKGVMKLVNARLIRRAGLRIMYDCANGSTVTTTPELLKRLGVKTVPVNATLDGRFPGHKPEPNEENLKGTIELAKRSNIDFAVVHDSDGDRSIFVSPKGEYIDGNYSLPVLAMDELRRGDAVVVPTNTTDVIYRVAKQMGVKLYETRVGAQSIVKVMLKTNAPLGGEENGGIILAKHQLCRDGAMSLVLFTEAVAKYGLDGLMSKLPKLAYYRVKLHSALPFEKVKRALLDSTRYIDVNYVDGIKLRIDNNTWIMARPSGTEPVLRLYAQARTRKEVDELIRKYRRIIENA